MSLDTELKARAAAAHELLAMDPRIDGLELLAATDEPPWPAVLGAAVEAAAA